MSLKLRLSEMLLSSSLRVLHHNYANQHGEYCSDIVTQSPGETHQGLEKEVDAYVVDLVPKGGRGDPDKRAEDEGPSNVVEEVDELHIDDTIRSFLLTRLREAAIVLTRCSATTATNSSTPIYSLPPL